MFVTFQTRSSSTYFVSMTALWGMLGSFQNSTEVFYTWISSTSLVFTFLWLLFTFQSWSRSNYLVSATFQTRSCSSYIVNAITLYGIFLSFWNYTRMFSTLIYPIHLYWPFWPLARSQSIYLVSEITKKCLDHL